MARRIPLILVQFLVQGFELGQARLREVDDVDGELLRCHFAGARMCYALSALVELRAVADRPCKTGRELFTYAVLSHTTAQQACKCFAQNALC